MERIKNMSLHPLRVEEDFGFQKLIIAEVDKLPLADCTTCCRISRPWTAGA